MIVIYCSGFSPRAFLCGIGSTASQFESGGTTKKRTSKEVLFFVFSQCDVEPTTFVVLLGLLCLFSCVVGFYVVHDFEACGALLAVKVHYVGAHLEAFAT